jgi:hypothetical protein
MSLFGNWREENERELESTEEVPTEEMNDRFFEEYNLLEFIKETEENN